MNQKSSLFLSFIQAEQEHTILFDVHDTGNLMLQPDPNLDFQRANPFPEIVVGNCFGASCRAEIFALFVQNLKANFACDVVINKPYSGGYVTQTYGQQCNAIQIEFDRATLCESKQRIAANSLEQRQKLLEKTIIATAKEFES